MQKPTNISIIQFEDDKFIRSLGEANLSRAAFTHYLHNSQNGVSKSFKKSALSHVESFLKYKGIDNEAMTKKPEQILESLINESAEKTNIPFPPTANPKFTFIDLFAGIGGFRIAMQNLGGKCVFTSEWDRYSQQTYLRNFGETPFGDITLDSVKSHVPNKFDVLCAGFPCQAFSIAGKRGGFEDTRGTLFFHVAEIIKKHKPRAFFLENVKGLMSNDKGRTIKTILNVLREDLGYYVPEPETMNAKDYGVPQKRARVFIAGFRKDQGVKDFKYPEPTDNSIRFGDVKEKDLVSVKYYLSAQYFKTLKNHRARHESKGQGFGYEIIPEDGIANAVVCGGMGRERNLVFDNRLTDFKPITNIKGKINREGIRKMTPREWARLQGFPDDFEIPVSDAQAYKQFGNSVAVPAIQSMAGKILEKIKINAKR